MTVTLERLPAAVRTPRTAVAGTFGVHGLLFSSWAAHIPSVAAHLRLDDAHLGLTLLGAPVGAVASVAATGTLLPRLGSRRSVQLAAVVYCLAGLLVPLAASPPLLFLALLVWGFGQGSLDVSMNTQAVYVERAAGRPVMPGLHGAWGLGAFAGAGLGTAAVALDVGLLPQLAVLGPLALAAVVAGSGRLLPDGPAPEPRPATQRWSRPDGLLMLLALAAFASMLCEGAAADWSALYLRGSTGASAAVGGLGYTVFALALLVVRLAGNRLLHRVPPRRLVPAAALLAAVGFGAGLATGDTTAGLVGLGCLGAGLALVVPSVFGAAGRLSGRHPGRSLATVSGLGWVGFVAAPPLVGGLAGASSLPVALALLPVLALVAAAASRRALPAQVER